MQKVPKGVKMAFRRGGYDWITVGLRLDFILCSNTESADSTETNLKTTAMISIKN